MQKNLHGLLKAFSLLSEPFRWCLLSFLVSLALDSLLSLSEEEWIKPFSEDNLPGHNPISFGPALRWHFLTLPVVIVSVEESIHSVPQGFEGSQPGSWSNKMADHPESSSAGLKIRYPYRYYSCGFKGSRRGGTYPVYRSCLLSRYFTTFPQRSIHVAGLSYLHYVNPIG